MYFEQQYLNIARNILQFWDEKKCRNWITKSVFWVQLVVWCLNYWIFPLITSRQMFYKWVFWEMAAFFRWPKHIDDFKKFGCNYWNMWAKPNWDLNLDYGNKWINFNWVNQMQRVLNLLKTDPNNRRMLITGWDPSSEDLSLPCCHYSYQFYVTESGKLDMIWNQRSADLMVWVPSDIVFAAAWLIVVAQMTWFLPWKINMMLGDTHIYQEHWELAAEQVEREIHMPPQYTVKDETNIFQFDPSDITIEGYEFEPKISYLLKE